MALFGLSPLFLSVIASAWFTDPVTESLDVTKFTAFLSVFLGLTYILGAITLRIGDSADGPEVASTPSEESIVATIDDETTLLLPERRKPVSLPNEGSVLSLIRQGDFWLIALFCMFTLGAVSSHLTFYPASLICSSSRR